MHVMKIPNCHPISLSVCYVVSQKLKRSDSELDDLEMVQLAMDSSKQREETVMNLLLADDDLDSSTDNMDDDDEEDQDCDFLPDRNQRKQYKFCNRRLLDATTPENMNDRKFKALFRMSRATFEVLFQMIVMYLPPGLSPNKKSIHPRERVLIFLAFIGGNYNN